MKRGHNRFDIIRPDLYKYCDEVVEILNTYGINSYIYYEKNKPNIISFSLIHNPEKVPIIMSKLDEMIKDIENLFNVDVLNNSQ
jgi:hypothetical protein